MRGVYSACNPRVQFSTFPCHRSVHVWHLLSATRLGVEDRLEVLSVSAGAFSAAPPISWQSRDSISTVAPPCSFGLSQRIEWPNTVEIESRDCQRYGRFYRHLERKISWAHSVVISRLNTPSCAFCGIKPRRRPKRLSVLSRFAVALAFSAGIIIISASSSSAFWKTCFSFVKR